MSPEVLLTAIIFLPAAWAIPLLWFPAQARDAMRYYALFGTAATFALSLQLIGVFDSRVGEMQLQVALPWIPNWNIWYRLGVDGFSLPLVVLTGLIFFLSLLASWTIDKQLKGFLILFLLLETGVMGVFLSLDFFLFYVFWEVMLLPMYFLIGIWGGARREYAAVKFFLYTFAGSMLMLIAMLMFYFNGGFSFDLLQLARIGQGREHGLEFSQTLQMVAFVLLFIGFAIKLPVVPFHTWLPDAHVEAPTPISMILAGVLLKMGGYGLIRVAFPLCPYGAQYFASVIVGMGVVSIIYGALAAMAQTDFKRLVAYSSVSHMGYVLLGLGAWKVSEATGAAIGRDQWEMGVNAAMYQMIGHGISSAGMFFVVGVVYDRVHHRDLNRFGGLAGIMPEYTGLSVGIFFAALGLPGLCGFIGEVMAVLGAWNFSPPLAIVAAFGVVLTAGYILWTIQRVYLGAEYRGPHPEALTPLSNREQTIAWVLLVLAVVLGVYPPLLLHITDGTVHQFVEGLDQAYRSLHQVGDPLTTMLD